MIPIISLVITILCWFPEMEVPIGHPFIVFIDGFSIININHPAIGVPPCLETPKSPIHISHYVVYYKKYINGLYIPLSIGIYIYSYITYELWKPMY